MIRHFFAVVLVSCLNASIASATGESFGVLTLDKSTATGVKAAVAIFEEGSTAPVLIKGTVKKVCKNEGCWMTLEDQGQSVFVNFKGHSFVVTAKLEGKQVVAEGVLQKKVDKTSASKPVEHKHATTKNHKHEGPDACEEEAALHPAMQFEAVGVRTI